MSIFMFMYRPMFTGCCMIKNVEMEMDMNMDTRTDMKDVKWGEIVDVKTLCHWWYTHTYTETDIDIDTDWTQAWNQEQHITPIPDEATLS